MRLGLFGIAWQLALGFLWYGYTGPVFLALAMDGKILGVASGLNR